MNNSLLYMYAYKNVACLQIMREGMEVSEKGYNWSDKLLKLSGQLYAIDEQRGRSEGNY